jgi:hypothetical protein
LPEDEAEDATQRWQVELGGLDVFDPITLETHHAGRRCCAAMDAGYARDRGINNGVVFGRRADQ